MTDRQRDIIRQYAADLVEWVDNEEEEATAQKELDELREHLRIVRETVREMERVWSKLADSKHLTAEACQLWRGQKLAAICIATCLNSREAAAQALEQYRAII